VRCAGERLPRQYSRRVLRQQPARRPHGYRFRSRNGSGRRHPAIRGMNRPARRCRSELPNGPPPRRRWPGPALRPKRSALRASQGCAPDQANKARGCVGQPRWESSLLEHPGAKIFQEKPFPYRKREKRAKDQNKKGTFLSRTKGDTIIEVQQQFFNFVERRHAQPSEGQAMGTFVFS
jgi:hypothetical protein